MNDNRDGLGSPSLDPGLNEQVRRRARLERCREYRERLYGRDPRDLASRAAMGLEVGAADHLTLTGEHFQERYRITWPSLKVLGQDSEPAPLSRELLWLHYLDRADGSPLAGRWVNLSEIGGLFYQQAFQGYCGDALAAAWGDNLKGLLQACRTAGGWRLPGPGDLACEWRLLPRVPVCLCYRRPVGGKPAWASLLFDASASHYVAADVAAIAGKELADRLMPEQQESGDHA